MKDFFLGMVGLVLWSSLGCGSGDEPSGDCEGCGADEYCVEYGSDVADEPSLFRCVALPTACEDEPTCTCLESVDDADSNMSVSLAFCLDLGTCQAPMGIPEVVCPGG